MLNGSMWKTINKTTSKTYEIALIAVLSAVCIVSRWTLTFLPNIKPVTSIIIIMSVKYGWRFGTKLAIVTTIISNMILGMGTWTIFQIFAWTIIALVSGLLHNTKLSKNMLFMMLWAAAMGYVFGFFVSWEKLMYGGFEVFLVYYLSGLFFDTLHAVGNFAFYPICDAIIRRSVKD